MKLKWLVFIVCCIMVNAHNNNDNHQQQHKSSSQAFRHIERAHPPKIFALYNKLLLVHFLSFSRIFRVNQLRCCRERKQHTIRTTTTPLQFCILLVCPRFINSIIKKRKEKLLHSLFLFSSTLFAHNGNHSY